MNKKTAFLFCLGAICSFALQAQPIVYINAGSRASYGNYQELIIERNGHCSYYLRQMNAATKDSSFFTLSRQQLDSIFRKAEAAGFFNLNTRYDGGARDGAGIFISMNNSGRKHSVQLINTDVPAINELITWLNGILAARGIRIYYGQNTGK